MAAAARTVIQPPTDAYRVKGLTFRAHLDYLKKTKLLDGLLPNLPAEAAALARNPPLPGSWVKGTLLDEFSIALHALKGDEAVLAMERAVIGGSLTQMFLSTLQGIFKVLGTSPVVLASRFQEATRRHVEGIEFRYEALSERSGTMTVRFSVSRPVPGPVFLSVRVSMEQILILCNQKKGVVTGPEVVGPHSARYHLQW